jgi:hypothetical protein
MNDNQDHFAAIIRYDFTENAGLLDVKDGSTPNMQICIGVFAAIDPRVVYIAVLRDGLPEIGYEREDRKWKDATAALVRAHEQV